MGKIPCGRKWQLTPVFLPGESQGRRSLTGYSPRGRKESDTTEQLILSLSGDLEVDNIIKDMCGEMGNIQDCRIRHSRASQGTPIIDQDK